jgi:hypothetical protein
VKLLDSKPLDWCVTGDYIALAMADGKLLITHQTVGKPAVKKKVPEKKSLPLRPIAPPPPSVLSASQSQTISVPSMSVPVPSMGFAVPPRSKVPTPSRPFMSPGRNRSRRSTFDTSPSKVDDLREIASEVRETMANLGEHRVRRKSSPVKKKPGNGLSAGIGLSFQILTDGLERVIRVAGSRLIVWSRSSAGVGNPVFVVDLKTRRVRHILGKLPGMSITDVIVSDNGRFWAVVINNSIVTVFGNADEPRQIGSLTFRWPVFLAFRAVGDAPMIVTSKGRVFIIHGTGRAGSVRARMTTSLDLTQYGKITGIVSCGSAVQLGTSSGAILVYDDEKLNVLAHTKSQIVRLIRSPLQSLIAIDDKSRGYFLSRDNDFSALPGAVRNAVMCGPLSFLVRIPHQRLLTPILLNGNYKALFPEFFFNLPLMKNPRLLLGRVLTDRKSADVETLERLGLPLLLHLRQQSAHPDWTAQQLRVLQQIFRSAEVTSRSALRISLFLTDFASAHAILRLADPASPDFFLNRFKLALFSADRLTPAIEMAVADLSEADMHDDAVDILLITGNWETAIGRQVEAGDLGGAILSTRARPLSDEKQCVLRELAEEAEVIAPFACAMMLLADCGDVSEIAQSFEKAGEVEQARIIPSLL